MAAIAALMLLLVQSADPSKTKRGERLAEVMRIGATLAPAKSHEPYLRAHEQLKDWHRSDAVREWIGDDYLGRGEQASALYDRVRGALPDPEWSDEEASLVRAWIAENRDCLKEIAEAVKADRVFFPLTPGETRDLIDADLAQPMNFRLTTLLRAAAAAAAREKDWPRAWSLIEQQVRIAGHEYQQPIVLRWLQGARMEQIAASQAIDLLSTDAAVPKGLAERWMDAVTRGMCPGETVNAVESLYAYDMFEVAMSWAVSGKPEPAMESLIEGMTFLRETMGASQPSSLASHAAQVRKMFRQSSLERIWTTYKRVSDVRNQFARTPFHQSWPRREGLKLKCAALLDEEPAIGTLVVEFGAMGMATDTIFSARARRLTQRNALRSILQLRAEFDRNGRYPRSLPSIPARPPSTTDDENAAGFDVFSGKPLIYRVSDDGKSFTLYSVGWNLVDDGGKLPTPPPESATPLEQTADPDGDIVFWPPTTR